MKILIALAALVGLYSLVQAQDHQCCTMIKASLNRHYPCNMSGCNVAMRLDSHPKLVEFLDDCREQDKHYTVVQKAMECAAPLMNRHLYDSFVFELEDAQNSQTHQQVQMSANIAPLVLGYGCIRNSRTDNCDGLSGLLLHPKAAHIFGLVAENVTEGDVKAKLTIDQAAQQCIASELQEFDESEWNQGMSQCSSAGVDTNPASFSSMSVAALTKGYKCELCRPSPQRDVVPFCANYFSTTRTNKYGVRCGKSLVADRLAQSFHSQWQRTGKANFNGKMINHNNNADCLEFLREVSCHTSMGVCTGLSSLNRLCKVDCEMAMSGMCSATAADAQSMCASIAATDTGSGCIQPAMAIVSPTVRARTNYTLVTNTGNKGDLFNVTFCSNDAGKNPNLLMTVITSVLADTCPQTAAYCELLDYKNSTNINSSDCSFRVDALLTTSAATTYTAQQFQQSFQTQTQVPSSQLTVTKTTINAPLIAEEFDSSAAAPVATLTLLMAALMASML